MTTLIVSFPTDVHSLAVRWGLSKLGEATDFLFWGDFPDKSTASFWPSDNKFEVAGPSISKGANYSRIWNRRRFSPLPPETIHPSDWPHAERIGRDYLLWLQAFAAANVFSVNTPAGKARAESKMTQLMVARQVGLKVPETLVSNDPTAVRAFVETQKATIVKTLSPMVWKGDGYEVSVLTSRINLSDLREDAAVRNCPMIYQAMVSKRREFRAVVMGHEVMLIEINSQTAAGAELDWRAVTASQLGLRQVPCSDVLHGQLIACNKTLGLHFGCYDLAEDSDGDTVFFEVNEQGAFLFIEDVCPDIPMLDLFVEFLQSSSATFRHDRTRPRRLFVGDYFENHLPKELPAELALHVPFDDSRAILE